MEAIGFLCRRLSGVQRFGAPFSKIAFDVVEFLQNGPEVEDLSSIYGTYPRVRFVRRQGPKNVFLAKAK